MHAEPLYAILLLLGAGVLAVSLFRSLNLPSILAYLMAGIILGSHGLNWLPDTELTRLLAELGVVFLLFVVGLEFSIPTLLASRRLVLGLGSAQVALVTLLAGLSAWVLGLPEPAALIIGGAVAMSSTAIVVKQLNEQLELNTRHGRVAVALLLFQDLATLPFLLILPKLAAGAGLLDGALVLALAKGIGVFAGLAIVGRKLLRPLFHWVAKWRSPELFMLTVLLTVLGAAAIAHAAGRYYSVDGAGTLADPP